LYKQDGIANFAILQMSKIQFFPVVEIFAESHLSLQKFYIFNANVLADSVCKRRRVSLICLLVLHFLINLPTRNK